MSEQTELLALVHEPVRTPRKTFREYGWYQLWKETLERPNAAAVIFGSWPFERPTQRHATVAASFIQWLGSNVGFAMRERIKKAQGGQHGELNWTTEWAKENARHKGVNSGLRIVEHILVPEPLREDKQAPDWRAVQEHPITLDDLDVIDNVMTWLATYDGMRFMKAADLAGDAAQEASAFSASFQPEPFL